MKTSSKLVSVLVYLLCSSLLSGCTENTGQENPVKKAVGDFAPIAIGNNWEFKVVRSYFSNVTSSAKYVEKDTGSYFIRVESISSTNQVGLRIVERLFKSRTLLSADSLIVDTSIYAFNSVDSVDSALTRLERSVFWVNKRSGYHFKNGMVEWIFFAPHDLDVSLLSLETFNGDSVYVFSDLIEGRNPPDDYGRNGPSATAKYVKDIGMVGYSYGDKSQIYGTYEADSLIVFAKSE